MSLMEFAVVNHFMGPGPSGNNKPKGVSEEDLHRAISDSVRN